jgi:trans-aconitate methyltransferase
MRLRDAVDLLAPADLATPGPTTWADLGAGEGTFTRALAEVLAPGSVIHAMDLDLAALRALDAAAATAHQTPQARTQTETRIITHRGDFTRQPWPFGDLDGIMMANSLHYVRDQRAFLTHARTRFTPLRPHAFLIVEYDTDTPNPWVPYPISRRTLATLFEPSSITVLGSRPSRYQRAAIYSALVREQRILRPLRND